MNTHKYKEILTMAVNNEVEAHEFYFNAAQKSKSENLRSVFNELAQEESNHKKTLEAFLNNEFKQMQFNDSKSYHISESVALPGFSSDMTFAEAITLAMKKEEEAMLMYTRFAEASTDEKQKEMFLQLAIMEKGHKVKLENIYSSTAYTEVW